HAAFHHRGQRQTNAWDQLSQRHAWLPPVTRRSNQPAARSRRPSVNQKSSRGQLRAIGETPPQFIEFPPGKRNSGASFERTEQALPSRIEGRKYAVPDKGHFVTKL